MSTDYKAQSMIKDEAQLQKISELDKDKQDLVYELEFLIRKQYQQIFETTEDPFLRLDAYILIRFLIARKWKLKDAKKMLEDWINWRQSDKPYKISLKEVWPEYKTGQGFMLGKNKDGYPILCHRARYHITSERDEKICYNYVLYFAEEGMKRLDEANGVDKVIMLYDASGISFKNLDVTMVQKIVKVLDMYPERLLKCYVYLPSWLFTTLYNIVKPFIDSKTAEKVVLVHSESELHSLIPKESLSPEYGGTFDFNFETHAKELEAQMK